MKKIVNLLLVLIMCLTLCACGDNDSENVGIANPMVEYDSLEEINEIVGIKLIKLEDDVTEEKYFVIADELAQYDFVLNGCEYCFRAAKNEGHDISGIYNGEGTIFENNDMEYGSYISDDVASFFFIAGEDRYNVSINGEIDDETFADVMEEIEGLVYRQYASQELVALIGDYQDCVSLRATMTISLFDDEHVLMLINWSSNANEYDEWSIMAKLNDNKIEYEGADIYHVRHIGEDEIGVNDSIGGYFEIKDDGIYWNGSGIENTENCQFTKINQ